RTNLSAISLWTAVTNVPVRVGNQYFVTNAISGAGKFYRLFSSPPLLSAMLSGNKVVVSWSATAPPSGVLKSATNLDASTWTPVTNSPVQIGSRYYVTNLTTASRAFYRLFF